jgi:hypothetical protein
MKELKRVCLYMNLVYDADDDDDDDDDDDV